MIEPDGTWDEMWTNTRFKHLTRVDFLDDYSVAMGQIAGQGGARSARQDRDSGHSVIGPDYSHPWL